HTLTCQPHTTSSPAHSTLPTFLFSLNDPPTTEIYTLSLHDALPIFPSQPEDLNVDRTVVNFRAIESGELEQLISRQYPSRRRARSEEHTSELQSRGHLVCRLLLEKKKTTFSSDDDTNLTTQTHTPIA